MHKIHYYKKANGESPVANHLRTLAEQNGKDSRIKLRKIQEYINALAEYGTAIGEPQIKHLDGEIWELRPLRDRILFAAWINGEFVLLHVFLKQTQKTPQKEIERAKRELADLKERGFDHE
ncbi:MAG: type II toxin-antitoxin system RelE/ParE family toxin [Oscillospiraceae bacterium]|nr:type II toxin-antitoxin system RelE/ParE family toxin [Oscillospiraceae bacterium]